MKISFIKKLYPQISPLRKNIKWRELEPKDINEILKEKQTLSNCYDIAVRNSLLKSKKGRELFSSRVKVESPSDSAVKAYKFKLNVKGKDEFYRVDEDDYYGRYFSLWAKYEGGKLNLVNNENPIAPFDLAVGIGISKMLKKHSSQKPLFSKLYASFFRSSFKNEYNLPSNSYRWYTGMEPTSIGEKSIRMNMKKEKGAVLELLDKLSGRDSSKYSFVLVTPHKKVNTIDAWHCVAINNVDNASKKVEVQDKISGITHKFSYEDVVDKFKAIVGLVFE